jgi:hypothetical protein
MSSRRIGFLARPKLSASSSARVWISQFRAEDQQAAADLLDALILLNEADVALAVRHQLRKLAKGRTGKRKKVALYVEREFAERAIFRSELLPGRDGKIRRRAIGDRGPAAVRPRRGSTRVGSEGPGAFLLSQAAEIAPSIFLNGPGPDRIRRHQAPLIVIVTDFIGTGTRVGQMLDKFMRVPSVRAWRSAKMIEFAVVAAATTAGGKAAVEAHRTRPTVHAGHIAPTLQTYRNQGLAAQWDLLARTYGPRKYRGAGPLGFLGLGALIAFAYRAPNNLPLFLHAGNRAWRPLFQGAISEDMAAAFGLQSAEFRTATASEVLGQSLAPQVTASEGQLALVLSVLRGPWRHGQEIEFAERTGLTVPEVLDARAYALVHGLVTSQGRLTDAGQAHIRSLTATSSAPVIPTNPEPYYPKALRVPR